MKGSRRGQGEKEQGTIKSGDWKNCKNKKKKKKKKKQIRNSVTRSREGGWLWCRVEWRGDIWWPEAICGDIFTPLLISNARTMCSGSFVTCLPNKLVTTSAASAAPNVCVYCALTVLVPTFHTQNAESFNRSGKKCIFTFRSMFPCPWQAPAACIFQCLVIKKM